jgi:pyruvate/2-oxoglutarate dehydrogenase complex dihydrolipoamide acyltransferase (E2) component
MATLIRMPDMGVVGGRVTVVSWLKKPGDPVVHGEPLLEVETDKGVTAVEATLAGVLVEILVPAGGTAVPDEPIALIRRWDEKA